MPASIWMEAVFEMALVFFIMLDCRIMHLRIFALEPSGLESRLYLKFRRRRNSQQA